MNDAHFHKATLAELLERGNTKGETSDKATAAVQVNSGLNHFSNSW